VVVTGAGDVSGVFNGALDCPGDADPTEVGLPDGAATAGTPTPALTPALAEIVEAGTDDSEGGTPVGAGAVAVGFTGGVSLLGA
jgi:hypothetical protein